MPKRCEAIKSDGSSCGSWAMRGKPHCRVHGGVSRERFLQDSGRGGKGRNRLAISDIEKILVRTERDLYQGRISETKARAFKGLADSMLKYFDAVDLHERLKALEQR